MVAQHRQAPVVPTVIIFRDILPRLPVKSLLRFTCIHKSWCTLIRRTPSFVTAYNLRNFACDSSPPIHLLLAASPENSPFSATPETQGKLVSVEINHDSNTNNLVTRPTKLPIDFLTSIISHQFSVLSVGGLICFVQADQEETVHIFNPCTREIVTLPPVDPTTRCNISTVGFGYTRRNGTDVYKVVRLRHHLLGHRRHSYVGVETPAADGFKRRRIETCVVVKICTLPAGTESSWRTLPLGNDLPFDPRDCRLSEGSVCLDGAIHWVDWAQDSLVAFDVGDEKFRPKKVPLPRDYTYEDFVDPTVIEFDGCVAISGKYLQALWILKDYEKKEWIKETIVFPVRSIPGRIRIWSSSTRYYRQNYTVIVKTVESWNEGVYAWLSLYDSKTKTFRTVNISPDWNIYPDHFWDCLAAYTQSIVPLKI